MYNVFRFEILKESLHFFFRNEVLDKIFLTVQHFMLSFVIFFKCGRAWRDVIQCYLLRNFKKWRRATKGEAKPPFSIKFIRAKINLSDLKNTFLRSQFNSASIKSRIRNLPKKIAMVTNGALARARAR